METNKPTILLAHGAWHPSSLYDPLKHALAARSYELLVPELIIMAKTGKSWDSDVSMLLKNAIPLFDQGKSIVIVGHSYGGIPACIATRGNSIDERHAAGKKGGFLQLVLIAAFAMPARDMSVLYVSGGSWLPWHQVIKLEPDSVSCDIHLLFSMLEAESDI